MVRAYGRMFQDDMALHASDGLLRCVNRRSLAKLGMTLRWHDCALRAARITFLLVEGRVKLYRRRQRQCQWYADSNNSASWHKQSTPWRVATALSVTVTRAVAQRHQFTIHRHTCLFRPPAYAPPYMASPILLPHTALHPAMPHHLFTLPYRHYKLPNAMRLGV